MFTNQVELINGLRGLPIEEAFQKLLDILPAMVGNCSQPWNHRGQVAIDIDGTKSPDVPYSAPKDEVNAALHAYNDPSLYNEATGMVRGGFAADFLGVVRMRPALALNNPVPNNVALVIPGDVVLNNIVDFQGNPSLPAIVWYTLTSSMTSGVATATVTCYTGPQKYSPGAVGATLSIYDAQGLAGGSQSGNVGMAVRSPCTGRFETLPNSHSFSCCGIATACCPSNTIPATLTATFTCGAPCTTLNTGTLTLRWNASLQQWNGSGTVGGDAGWGLSLACAGGIFGLSITLPSCWSTASPITGTISGSPTCSPAFSVVFTFSGTVSGGGCTGIGAGASGTITVTITA